MQNDMKPELHLILLSWSTKHQALPGLVAASHASRHVKYCWQSDHLYKIVN